MSSAGEPFDGVSEFSVKKRESGPTHLFLCSSAWQRLVEAQGPGGRGWGKKQGWGQDLYTHHSSWLLTTTRVFRNIFFFI